jgi:hypothetical protein
MEQTVRKQVEEIKEADLWVGVFTYNNAHTIGHVLQTVSIGLASGRRRFEADYAGMDGNPSSACS